MCTNPGKYYKVIMLGISDMRFFNKTRHSFLKMYIYFRTIDKYKKNKLQKLF